MPGALGDGVPRNRPPRQMTRAAEHRGRSPFGPAARRFFVADEGARMGFLIVFVGGGIGAALRHGVNLALARLLGSGFNYATLFENVSGSFIMGMLVAYFAF